MEERHAAITDALEALHMNQQAIRAGTEEIALWVRARGSENTFQSAMVALQALDTSADVITSAIERLRSSRLQGGFLLPAIFRNLLLGVARKLA